MSPTLIATCLIVQVLEELLVVDPCHTTDLFHLGLGSCVSVYKVGRDSNGQPTSQLLVLKTWNLFCEQENKKKQTSKTEWCITICCTRLPEEVCVYREFDCRLRHLWLTHLQEQIYLLQQRWRHRTGDSQPDERQGAAWPSSLSEAQHIRNGLYPTSRVTDVNQRMTAAAP